MTMAFNAYESQYFTLPASTGTWSGTLTTTPAISASTVQKERADAAKKEAIAAKLDAFGADVFRKGTVLTWVFCGAPMTASRRKKGYWDTGGKICTWDELVAKWVNAGVVATDVWMVTEYTPAFG